MSLTCFIIAFTMLTYDWIGHVICGIVRIQAAAGIGWPAQLWNTWSPRIWPIKQPLQYDIYWSLWHGLTLALFLLAYVTKGKP